MKQRQDDWSPDPRQLAAFIDGQLTDDPAVSQRIRAWLAEHPDAETPERLTELVHATRPSDPGEHVWAAMRSRLVAGISQPSKRLTHRASGLRWGLASAACAAAVLLAVGLWPRVQTPSAPPLPVPRVESKPVEEKEAEVFAVATGDEIEIIRIEGADLRMLLLPHIPLPEPLKLAGHKDVTVNRVEPAENDSMVPELRNNGQGPMFWAQPQKDQDDQE